MLNKLLILDGTSLVNEAYNSTLTTEVEEANALYNSAKTEEEKEQALTAKNEAYKTLLQSTSGEFINAVQEFFKDFLDALDKLNPSHVAVVWGTSRKTNYKREIYAEYKKDDRKMDEPLKQQFESIKNILNEIGVAQYRSEKYEALDIAGSIAQKYKDVLPTYIVARNKSSIQLCDNSTVWLKSSKRDEFAEEFNIDLSNVPENLMEFTKDRVKLIYGLTPSEYINFRALVGSPSSGIPGAPGIGEASALPLIQYFGTIENMYKQFKEASAEDEKNPKGKVLKKFTDSLRQSSGMTRLPTKAILQPESEEMALLSKKLVTIKTDILVEDKKLDININRVILVKEMSKFDLANEDVFTDSQVYSSSFSGLIRTYNPTILSPSSEDYVGNSLSIFLSGGSSIKDSIQDNTDVNYTNNQSNNSLENKNQGTTHIFITDNSSNSSNDDEYYHEYEEDYYYDDEDYYNEYDENEYYYEDYSDDEEKDENKSKSIDAIHIIDFNNNINAVSYDSEQTTITDLMNKKNAFTVLEVVTAYKYQCNHCNEYFTTEGKPAKFCPHCGTKNNSNDNYSIPVIENSNCNLSDMKVK